MAQLTPMGLVKILGQVTAIMVIPIVGGAVAGLILDGILETSPAPRVDRPGGRNR